MELDQMPPANEPQVKMPTKSTHWATLERPMDRQASRCYCNKRKDHDITPRTPRIDNFGNVWGGPEVGKEKVVISGRGFLKVTPTPVVLIKHETPIFAELQREWNAQNRNRMAVEEAENALSLDD